jgi:hypothetical protein
MIQLYATENTKRLRFVCKVIFERILGCEYEITSDEEVFASNGAIINYSAKPELGGVHIKPHGLLSKKGFKEIKVDWGDWEGNPTIFPQTQGELPFDLFAASFFLLSRYEEYSPFKTDKHGRFEASESIAQQQGFLHLPVVDIWALKLWDLMKSKHQDLARKERKFTYISTVDVDSAFAYRSKGLVRTLGGIAKDLWAKDLGNLGARLKVVLTRKHDPFDTYSRFIELHREHGVKGIFFFLMADYGHNDKNVPHSSLSFHKRIKLISDYHDVGIHPGFMSNNEPERLPKEIKRLESIVKSAITKSRQHFLIQRFPETHQRLIDQGIEEDYSLGYASDIGFRGGTCTPYPMYDLENETITTLMLFPFTLMDSTLNFYLNLSPEKAIEKIGKMIEVVKEVNGTFISLWHNESLSDKWHWNGWSEVYEEMLKLATAE